MYFVRPGRCPGDSVRPRPRHLARARPCARARVVFGVPAGRSRTEPRGPSGPGALAPVAAEARPPSRRSLRARCGRCSPGPLPGRAPQGRGEVPRPRGPAEGTALEVLLTTAVPPRLSFWGPGAMGRARGGIGPRTWRRGFGPPLRLLAGALMPLHLAGAGHMSHSQFTRRKSDIPRTREKALRVTRTWRPSLSRATQAGRVAGAQPWARLCRRPGALVP